MRISEDFDRRIDLLSKETWGISLTEAIEKQICVSCKKPVSFSVTRDRLSYELDGLCVPCGVEAAKPVDFIPESIWNECKQLRENLLAEQEWREKQKNSAPIEVKLRKLSICSCGYGMLQDEIKLGTPYKIWVDEIKEMSFFCGGCEKTTHKIPCVLASQHIDKAAAPAALPLELFDYKGS